MPSIQIMDEQLANKIAAGEVVERPASVVKELVENAIDAHSTIIEVSVKEGGLDEIKVVDNGEGMDREDALLSLARHASSKLTSEQDLFRITSLGFRGEALPSIASVSNLTMQTWNGEEECGTKVFAQGGEIIEVSDAPLRQGTMMEIKELFYNTPARYKYVKSTHTEISHIADYINRLALANPQIAFSLKHNGRQLLKTNGNGELLAVIAEIYGRQTAHKMIPISLEHIDFQVEGYLAKPEVTRANRQYISILINGRYVKNTGLSQMVQRAYHTMLPLHRFPIAILNIKLDPSLVDVNVHPAKLEVRISKERELIEWLEEELANILRSKQTIPQPVPQRNKQAPPKINTYVQESMELQLPKANVSVVKEKTYPDKLYDEAEDMVAEPVLLTEQTIMKVEQKPSEGSNDLEQRLAEIPLLHPLGQLHGTYILAQNEHGLYMIDQHAAQERIWYEYYYQKLNEPIRETQALLVPLVIECTPNEAVILKEFESVLAEMGLFVEEFGYHTYMIRSHPAWFPSGEEEAIIREIIDYLLSNKKAPEWIQLREKMAIMMSCKQAIKANKFLTHQEMESLLEQLRMCSNPFTCPHGRPITVLLSTYEIEKMFKRVK